MSKFNHLAAQRNTRFSATDKSVSERLQLWLVSLAFRGAGRHVLILTFAFLSILADLAMPRSGFCQNNPPARRVEAELITVRQNGFEPKEITRPAGQFLLAIDNRSGLEVVLLRLDPAAGGDHLRNVQVNRKKLDWRDLVDLVPGRYVLSEANHPEWVCNIVVTAR